MKISYARAIGKYFRMDGEQAMREITILTKDEQEEIGRLCAKELDAEIEEKAKLPFNGESIG